MDSRLYLGVPNKLWDSLAAQAEDILCEEKIGQHLLGIYPAGPRIYGDISCSPGILCIYIDEPLALLDPTQSSITPIIKKTTQDGHNIQYTELYSWIKKVISAPQELANNFTKTYTHIIPAVSEAHYVGEEMTYIANLVSNYLRKSGWDIPHNDHGYLGSLNLIQEAAYLRARVLLREKGIFAPCLNRDWDQIESLENMPEHIATIDTELINYLSSNIDLPTTANLIEYCDWGYNYPWTYNTILNKKEIEQLGNTVSKLFSSLL